MEVVLGFFFSREEEGAKIDWVPYFHSNVDTFLKRVEILIKCISFKTIIHGRKTLLMFYTHILVLC